MGVARSDRVEKQTHQVVFRDKDEAVCSCGAVLEWDWEAGDDISPSLAHAFGAHLQEQGNPAAVSPAVRSVEATVMVRDSNDRISPDGATQEAYRPGFVFNVEQVPRKGEVIEIDDGWRRYQVVEAEWDLSADRPVAVRLYCRELRQSEGAGVPPYAGPPPRSAAAQVDKSWP